MIRTFLAVWFVLGVGTVFAADGEWSEGMVPVRLALIPQDSPAEACRASATPAEEAPKQECKGDAHLRCRLTLPERETLDELIRNPPELRSGWLSANERFPPAFDSLAEPSRIGIGESASALPTDADGAGSSSEASEYSHYVVFAQPASFALPQFGPHGQRSPRKAVVIYEGMAVRIRSDGTYTVRMVVETPPTDVELRMQFQLLKPDPSIPADKVEPVLYDQLGTITLPAIRFLPSRDQTKSPDTLYWKVEQKGYSRLLHVAAGGSCDKCLRLVRAGVMEMGSGPETAEY